MFGYLVFQDESWNMAICMYQIGIVTKHLI